MYSVMFKRTTFQTSNIINRVKCVKNKKMYNESICKNRQYIRKMTTYNKPPILFGNGPNRNNIIYMILSAVSFNIYLNIKKTNSKEE